MSDSALRDHLVNLLRGRDAHAELETVVREFPMWLSDARLPGIRHTPWRLLEHLRIAQWDILEFSRNAEHVSPEFPEGYWPEADAPVDEDAWIGSVNAFCRDLRAMQDLVADAETDLFAPIPHGDGQTILREALLLADHNAYHAGQLMLMRRALGA